MPTTYAIVEFPPPTVVGSPCPDCKGSGVTGDQYEMQHTTPVLLVDVFCPTCLGCGSANHDAGCEGHAWDDIDRDDDELDDEACPSCKGREWNAVQGFPGYDVPADAGPVMLRVPCGCTTARARVWTVTAEPQRRSR